MSQRSNFHSLLTKKIRWNNSVRNQKNANMTIKINCSNLQLIIKSRSIKTRSYFKQTKIYNRKTTSTPTCAKNLNKKSTTTNKKRNPSYPPQKSINQTTTNSPNAKTPQSSTSRTKNSRLRSSRLNVISWLKRTTSTRKHAVAWRRSSKRKKKNACRFINSIRIWRKRTI